MSQKTIIQRVFDVISESNQKHGRLQGIIDNPRRPVAYVAERKAENDVFRRTSTANEEKELSRLHNSK